MADKIELTDEELQDRIEAAVAEATSGLKNKNTELLGELKKARKAGEITPEQLAEVEAERDKFQGDLAAMQKEMRKLQKEHETLGKSLETESNFTRSLLIDSGLVQELTKNNVTNPVHLKAAAAILKQGGIEVIAEGETRTARVGDKSLSDYVKGWAESDEGKHFVAAQNNSGGGANGGNGGRAAKVEGKLDGTPSERAAYFSSKFPELNTA